MVDRRGAQDEDLTLRLTHDLTELVRLCKSLDTSFHELDSAADALTPFAVKLRYPGEEHSDPTLTEMEEARVHA